MEAIFFTDLGVQVLLHAPETQEFRAKAVDGLYFSSSLGKSAIFAGFFLGSRDLAAMQCYATRLLLVHGLHKDGVLSR